MTIYAAQPSQVYSLNVTQSLNENVGFPVSSVIIDNITSQWLYMPDILRYVPPYQVGVILPYPGRNTVTAIFATPPGRGTADIYPEENATVNVLSAEIPPSAGSNSFVGVAGGHPILSVADGYDTVAPDGVYVPARTANTFLYLAETTGVGGGSGTLYTPPAGQIIRLLWLEAGINVPGARIYLTVNDQRITSSLTNHAESGVSIIPFRVYPGNGLVLPAGVALGYGWYQANGTGNLEVCIGLYVGA